MKETKKELPIKPFKPTSKLLDHRYQGPVYIWDIDKTYLATTFETWRGLIKTAFEKAHEKKNIAGTATLLREIYKGRGENKQNPIFFISASPPQMKKVIEKKMSLDGISYDGIVFKDNLKNIYKWKFKKIREQVGYKLKELLRLKSLLPQDSREYLFGDNYENDPLIYSLYSDICSEQLSQDELKIIFTKFKVHPEDQEDIFSLIPRLHYSDSVEKIFIHLVKKADIQTVSRFNSKIIPTFNSFQAALALYDVGLIYRNSVIHVVEDLYNHFGFSQVNIAQSLLDSYERSIIGESTLVKLVDPLKAYDFIGSDFGISKIKTLWESLKKKIIPPPPTESLPLKAFQKYMSS